MRGALAFLPPGVTDDVINVAGHRLSTGAMEEVLAAHFDVAECAVVGAKDALKGQIPLGLVVLKAGVDRPHEAVAAFREASVARINRGRYRVACSVLK